MTYVKLNGVLYPAEIEGKAFDKAWDNRASKEITLEIDHATAADLFVSGMEWAIVEQILEGTETVETEWDNSEYSIAGDITDHRDGTITAKMGKLTALEEAYELLLGGVE